MQTSTFHIINPPNHANTLILYSPAPNNVLYLNIILSTTTYKTGLRPVLNCNEPHKTAVNWSNRFLKFWATKDWSWSWSSQIWMKNWTKLDFQPLVGWTPGHSQSAPGLAQGWAFTRGLTKVWQQLQQWWWEKVVQQINKEGAGPICLVDTNSDWISDANKAPFKLNTTNLRGQGHIRTNPHFTWTCKRSCSSIFKVNHSFLVSLTLQILFHIVFKS